MTVVWQNVVVVCIVVGAVFYVARRAWRSGTSNNSAACHPCAHCPLSPGENRPVSIDRAEG